ncbi:MAG TPA: hypothetical protein VGS17_09750 [Candidatus Limnocylindria bacterium]|nr:hypothetical protein [Candidatus Limnocylindria bacterium]
MIEDLDGVIEPRASWRARWLLPIAGGALLSVVLAASFLRFTPAPVSVLHDVGPANGIKSLELPRAIATAESRLQFSGVTGLTSMRQSDGFRDLYRFADGRVLLVIEYPDPANGTLIAPASGPASSVSVRGVKGEVYPSISTSMPLIVGWIADGMQYHLGGAGFTTDDLLRLAEALR